MKIHIKIAPTCFDLTTILRGHIIDLSIKLQLLNKSVKFRRRELFGDVATYCVKSFVVCARCTVQSETVVVCVRCTVKSEAAVCVLCTV